MRTKLLSLAVFAVVGAGIQADPPARLGLPPGAVKEEVLMLPPRSLPIAPAPMGTDVITIPGPSLASPPALGGTSGVPAAPTQTPARMTPGYPSSFPPPSNGGGVLPKGATLMSGPIPAAGLTPGLLPPATTPLPGSTPPNRNDLIHPATLPVESKGRLYGTGPCGPIEKSLGCEKNSDSPFTDNLSFFFGIDGAKEPIDLGINARFGTRLHINWGLPLVEDWNLGLHLGAGYNFGHNAVRVLRSFEASRDNHQAFFTLGLFQRTDAGLNWEVAWDFRNDNYFEQFSTSQWRGLLSVDVNEHNEVGFWGTYRDRIDRGNLGTSWFNVKSINQINLFWRHTWDMQIATGLWAGIAEEHGRFVLIAPGESAVRHPFIFGADLFVPLSDRLAIFGEAQFITPNDSGTVVATLGLAWYPSGRPAAQGRSTFSPLLPTANNASFSLDLQQ